MGAALERPACDSLTSDEARPELVVEVVAYLLGRGIKELRELLVHLLGSLPVQHADIQPSGSDKTGDAREGCWPGFSSLGLRLVA
jgi:hypothetical protein